MAEKLTPVFAGKVDDAGALQVEDGASFRRYLLWSLRGQRVEVVVRKLRAQRSNQANRYYHGVVIALIAEHLGYEHDEAHEAVAWHLLQLPVEAGKLARRQSTASMNTAEFAAYVERVKRWAAEDLGIYIPDANEVDA